jgi:DNA polymerase elongation subunit (family B)
VEKHRSNPQYFKGKKLQSKIFNQLNIKKLKLTKIILKKKTNKKKEKKKCKKNKVKKNKKYKEKCKKKKEGMHCGFNAVIHSDFGVGQQ